MTVSEISAAAPRYAGLVRRVAAGLLDLVVAWAVYSIAIMLLAPDAASEYATTWETVLAALILVAVAALWLGYLVFAQWRWGQTLGMSAVGIEVVGDRDQGLSWPGRSSERLPPPPLGEDEVAEPQGRHGDEDQRREHGLPRGRVFARRVRGEEHDRDRVHRPGNYEIEQAGGHAPDQAGVAGSGSADLRNGHESRWWRMARSDSMSPPPSRSIAGP